MNTYIDREYEIEIKYNVIDLINYEQYKCSRKILIRHDVEIDGAELSKDEIIDYFQEMLDGDYGCDNVDYLNANHVDAWLIGDSVYVFENYDVVDIYDSEIEI